MAGETANISEIANKVSEDLFKWFKWSKVPLMDENFTCVKNDSHAPKKVNHTHPVDAVFHYFDPHLNKEVYLNTDLKSYAKNSITAIKIRDALKSLATTIDCARASAEWKSKYILEQKTYEIRGMLFVYNHDGEYDKSFYETFKGVSLDSIKIQKDQLIHIVNPALINYMHTIVGDMTKLHHEGKFPEQLYSFFYPDLYLHKAHGSHDDRAATIESIAAPYLIIQHEAVTKYDEKEKSIKETFQRGFLVYYNRDGGTDTEFMYLFDALSRFQILNQECTIRIRVANSNPSQNIMPNYSRAINLYVMDWEFDEYKRKQLENISLELVDISKPFYCPSKIGWRDGNEVR